MTKKELIKRADYIFSKWIKDKYEVNGFIRCYTCGRVFSREDIENGHFIVRDHKSLRWEQNNARPQCKWMCNRQKKGNIIVYEENLAKELKMDLFFLEDNKNDFGTYYIDILNDIKTTDLRDVINYYKERK
jgi:hypothetical protein